MNTIAIPEQYAKAELTDCPKHEKTVLQWLKADLPGMITLTGPAGTGKTRVIYAVVKLCKNARLWDIPSLVVATQHAAMMQPDAYNWAETHPIDALIKHEKQVLLDDFGAEKTTAFALQELYRLIYQRELWQKPTMISTNLSLGEIAEKLDDRIASRLSGGTVLQFSGPDYRLHSGRSSQQSLKSGGVYGVRQ